MNFPSNVNRDSSIALSATIPDTRFCAAPGVELTSRCVIHQISISSIRRPAFLAPASNTSRQLLITSSEIPRPISTPSAISPASCNDLEPWAAIYIGILLLDQGEIASLPK